MISRDKVPDPGVMKSGMPWVDYRIKPPIEKDYHIGIIGAGIITNLAHIPAYRNALLKVAGIAEVDAHRLESTCARWGIDDGYNDYRRLLDREDIQIIDIAIGHKDRVQVVRDCVDAGKHILIQKPFAHVFGDALRMTEIAEEGGVRLLVNQSMRYSPVFVSAKQLIDQGWIGEPYLIQFFQNINSDRVDPDHWFQELENFVLIEMTVHYIDIMRFLAAREVRAVSASLTRRKGQVSRGELVVSMKLDFADGLHAMLCDNNATLANDQGMRYRVDGSEGTIKGGYDLGPNKELIHYNEQVELFSRLFDDAWYRPSINMHYFPDALAGPMVELMDCVTEKRSSPLNARNNLEVLRVALAGYKSAVEGRTVSPNEIGPDSRPYGKF